MSLWSISVPDAALADSTVFTDLQTQVFDIGFTLYELGGFQQSDGKFMTLTQYRIQKGLLIQDVMNQDFPVTTRVGFWKNCVRAFECRVEDEMLKKKTANPTASRVAVPDRWKLTFSWEGNDMILEGVDVDAMADPNDRSYSWFGMTHSIAQTFGFLKWDDTSKKYILGPNVVGTYCLFVEDGKSISTVLMNLHPLSGTTRAASTTEDIDTTDPKVDWIKVDGTKVFFGRALRWKFVWLNDSFDALLNTKETVMVYSDLVQLTVVGTGRFPLL